MSSSWHQILAWLDARSALELLGFFVAIYGAMICAERLTRLVRWWRRRPRPAARAAPQGAPRMAQPRGAALRVRVNLIPSRRS